MWLGEGRIRRERWGGLYDVPVGLQFEVLVELARDLVELEPFRAGLVAQARAEVGFGASDVARGACPEKEDG